MSMELIKEQMKTDEDRMNKTVAVLRNELQTIRAGRANPQLLDRITVDYYGTQMKINQLGNIAVPEPRLLTISLYDPKAISSVEKAIRSSDLNLNPSNDGKLIRIIFPELTEERRKELCKTASKTGEESKIAIRAIRRDFNDRIKKLKKDSDITEDEEKKAEDDIQKLTDQFIKDIDKLIADKEKDIMEV